MARAMKCDRCGKFYAYYDGNIEFKNSELSNGVILINRDLDNGYWERKSYDLCIDCMRKLEKFIKNDADMVWAIQSEEVRL